MSCAMTKIDWLAFTIPLPTPSYSGSDNHWNDVFSLIKLNIGDVLTPILDTGNWQVQQGRGFYQHARMDAKTKVKLSIGETNSDVYVECSGQACENVRSAGCFYEIFQQESIRFSRIDLACDFENNLSVDEIISKGYKPSIKTRADYRTIQGDTTYIGSRKSERMLRVYRYHEPHPRSNLLRFEVEIKGDTAKAISRQITAISCAEVTRSALLHFGLKHTLLHDFCVGASPLRSRPADKARKGRMRWLMTSVLPALVKAHREGDIDARDFMETHLYPATD